VFTRAHHLSIPWTTPFYSISQQQIKPTIPTTVITFLRCVLLVFKHQIPSGFYLPILPNPLPPTSSVSLLIFDPWLLHSFPHILFISYTSLILHFHYILPMFPLNNLFSSYCYVFFLMFRFHRHYILILFSRTFHNRTSISSQDTCKNWTCSHDKEFTKGLHRRLKPTTRLQPLVSGQQTFVDLKIWCRARIRLEPNRYNFPVGILFVNLDSFSVTPLTVEA
jgi:hypothetical protein